MTIGERLKEERSRLGFNQTDMAAFGGVGKTTQINYEKGNGAPDAKYLAALAEKGGDVLYVVTGARAEQIAAGLSDQEAELIEAFRHMGKQQQDAILLLSSSLTPLQRKMHSIGQTLVGLRSTE